MSLFLHFVRDSFANFSGIRIKLLILELKVVLPELDLKLNRVYKHGNNPRLFSS